MSEFSSIIVTDCGSTTTKAIWFKKDNNVWKVLHQAEAPTTVEKPLADVTIGVSNAFRNLEKVSDLILLNNDQVDSVQNTNYDLYCSTSSAGGGLQMLVMGIMSELSTKAASKAALGGGAIVLSEISLDDEATFFERVKELRDLRPDIILIAGGVEGGGFDQVRELVEILISAEPKNRFSTDILNPAKIPVIYAGTSNVIEELRKIIEKNFSLTVVPNLMPNIQVDNFHPAREAIHDVFLSHVMSQAPGYSKLLEWSDKEVIPTPVAVSKIISAVARNLNTSILASDIGGATTDIFSVRDISGANFNSEDKENKTIEFGECERSVSANLGMSYSIGNVLKNSSIERIAQWLPFEVDQDWISEVIWNKMYRPTSLPDTKKELLLEQAVAREALRLSLQHHADLVGGVPSAKKEKGISSFFNLEEESGFKIDQIDFILGSGGVVSHAPNRGSATLMLLDSFRPKGVTFLAVDSIFMLPHLGSLSQVYESASLEIFLNECIIPLGTVVSPKAMHKSLIAGSEIAKVNLGDNKSQILKSGELVVIPLKAKEIMQVEVVPLSKKLDLGLGGGKKIKSTVKGGYSGLIFDTRDLDQHLKSDRKSQIKNVINWQSVLDIN